MGLLTPSLEVIQSHKSFKVIEPFREEKERLYRHEFLVISLKRFFPAIIAASYYKEMGVLSSDYSFDQF